MSVEMLLGGIAMGVLLIAVMLIGEVRARAQERAEERERKWSEYRAKVPPMPPPRIVTKPGNVPPGPMPGQPESPPRNP